MGREGVTYLVDTNVLVYAHGGSNDGDGTWKPNRARAVLRLLAGNDRAALPAQALAEFANVALRKLNIANQEVYRQIDNLARVFPILTLSEWTVLEAVRGVRDHRFSYYNAQIWALARLHQVPTVLTEDFASGATVEGVTFVNPFGEGFDLASLA